jgi:hypothetical protein
MDSIAVLLAPPVELEAWLILAYVVAVVLGARIFEFVAKFHFERARRYAEHGFEYDAHGDHYHCRQGERLSLHLHDVNRRLAVYRAPPSSCNGCTHKDSCTPHDEGRHLYRSLAEWAETDIGRFHQWLSLVLFAVGALLSAAAVIRCAGGPGTGLFAVTAALNVWFLAWDLGKTRTERANSVAERR